LSDKIPLSIPSGDAVANEGLNLALLLLIVVAKSLAPRSDELAEGVPERIRSS
jgi:hypothetical protein